MRATASTVGYRTVVTVEGEIDMATAGELNRELAAHVASAAQELWVDLSRVTFMDSHGIHALLGTQALLDSQGRRLTVICPPGPVRRVLALAEVDSIIDVFPTRTSAQRAH